MQYINLVIYLTCILICVLIYKWMYVYTYVYIEGETPKQPELSSGGRASCTAGFPHLGDCSRKPSVPEYQLALLWEAVFCFRDLVLKTLSTCSPISWWVILKHTCSHCAVCSAVFVQNGMTSLPSPFLLTQCLPMQHFFVIPWWKKSIKGNILLM